MSGTEMGEGRDAWSDGSSSALRVVFLLRTDGFPDGMASTNRARLMASALAEAGAEVDVLCTQANEPARSPRNRCSSGSVGAVRFEYTTGISTRPSGLLARRLVDARGFLVLVRRLRAMRNTGIPMVCYSWITPPWNPWYSTAVLIALHALRIPCVLELNEPIWVFGPGSRGGRKVFSSLRGMAGVVTISTGLEEWARKDMGHRGRTIPLVRIPAIASRDASVAMPTDRPGPPRVVLACAPAYRGRILFLLSAMERVWAVRDCELVIAGFDEGDPRAEWLLSEQVYVRNRERIVLTGHLDAATLHAQYALAAALVAPLDDNERSVLAFPTKVAEYLMTGRPVITSDIGDAGRLLRENGGAYLAAADDVGSFADRLLEVLADPRAAEEVGRVGRAVALRELDVARYGGALARFMGDIARSSIR
jgi:glycosyltransferase involved in cell wall biosynthesis